MQPLSLSLSQCRQAHVSAISLALLGASPAMAQDVLGGTLSEASKSFGILCLASGFSHRFKLSSWFWVPHLLSQLLSFPERVWNWKTASVRPTRAFDLKLCVAKRLPLTGFRQCRRSARIHLSLPSGRLWCRRFCTQRAVLWWTRR